MTYNVSLEMKVESGKGLDIIGLKEALAMRMEECFDIVKIEVVEVNTFHGAEFAKLKLRLKEKDRVNTVFLSGRLTSDPEIKYTTGGNPPMAVARYRLAVDRKFKKEGEQNADFISCVTFGKNAEFAGRYLRKGMKIIVGGGIKTGSYTDKDGKKVYTTDVVVDWHEFCESKQSESTESAQNTYNPYMAAPSSDFTIPEDDSDLPF